MASVKNLKKDINFVLGDIIEAVYLNELAKDSTSAAAGEAIVDEAITVFDDLIKQVNAKKVENKKEHFKQINKKLEETANQLIGKLNAL
jgi:response regulator of citrate/malate metabolism